MLFFNLMNFLFFDQSKVNLNTSNVILQSKYGDIPFYADSDLNTSNVILQLDLF